MTHLSTFSHRFPFGLLGSVVRFRTIGAGSAVAEAALHWMPPHTRRLFAGRIKHLSGLARIDRILLTLLAGARAVTHERDTCMPATPSAAQRWIPDEL